MMPTLGGFATVRDNNFNLLRCLAALMVIYAHSWGLADQVYGNEPLKGLLGNNLGALAVNAFFIISGYLVTQSWGRQRSLLNFCRARVLRVLPGLLGVLIFTLLAAGFFWSSLSAAEFFRDSQTWKYLYKNLLMIKTQYDLPGVFTGNHYPDAVNGSLWTLRFEMKMYLALAVLGSAHALVSAWDAVVGLCVEFRGDQCADQALFSWPLLSVPSSWAVLFRNAIGL